ncbi:unnamed protein product [Plutella xylostella]|uniref:Phospholipid scramblase n=1 Tax=Plutella xylostella TaxID=51655 RepID=A0A8S4G8C6_PLUXY|nr:unnamed protein product [Plutella xylostella]
MERDQYPKEGIDNPGATEDDGSNLRPDLVISVATASSLWGVPRPAAGVHGGLAVRGRADSSSPSADSTSSSGVTACSSSRPSRSMRGESLYIASEVSTATQRCLCGAGRAFTMHLHDNTRQEALQLQRRLAAASCCFPCRLQEMLVITPPGDYVGRVQQQCSWLAPAYLVKDAADQVLYVVEGPAQFQRSALVQSEFKIMSPDGLRVAGRIVHGWDRELVSFTTTLHVPASASQPRHKALLLAATFLMVCRGCMKL